MTLGIHEPTQVLALIDSVQEKRKESEMQFLSQRIFYFKQGDILKQCYINMNAVIVLISQKSN